MPVSDSQLEPRIDFSLLLADPHLPTQHMITSTHHGDKTRYLLIVISSVVYTCKRETALTKEEKYRYIAPAGSLKLELKACKIS